MKQIARALNVGENKLLRILTAVGFEYDASLKEWCYTRLDEMEILQRSFWSLDEYGVGYPDNMSNIPFTQDEILILKELAARHATAAPVTDSTGILEAIQDVPKGKTTKKTFALNDGVIDRLDAFCDTHRIKKSDFVTMAIQDALNKFNS